MGGGRKLVGSAQWRRLDGVLQHGSLPLSGDIARVCKYLIGSPEPEQVCAHAGTLSEIVGRDVSWAAAAEAWQQAFADTLDIDFQVEPLSDEELRSADEVRASRYANDTWTRRR